MVFRRKKRPTLYFQAKRRFGFTQLSTHTTDKLTAQRIEHMWAALAGKRAWDLLEPVLAAPETIGALYDLWEATKHNTDEMRRRREDVDLEPLVADWHAVYTTHVAKDSADHALVHVRFFFPAGTPRLRSTVTDAWLTELLATYPGRRNTLRKVHSSLSSFLGEYCTGVKKLFPVNPMDSVKRPKLQQALPDLYDADAVARIVEWQPTPARRAFMALVYGTGADVSAALTVERSDVSPERHEVRIKGTKTAFRDRIVRVSDALWPVFWRHAKTVLTGRIWPATWNRWTVSDWHRDATGALELAKRLPLRKARHHFAVRLLQAGAPVRVVSEQLGSDERTVLRHYGPWITSPDDRARAETLAVQHETHMRKAE